MSLANFAEDGYTIVRGFFTNEDLQPLRDMLSAYVDRRTDELYAEGKISETFADLPFNLRWAEVCKMHKQTVGGWNREIFSKEIYDLCTHPKLLDVVEQIVGPEITVNGDYSVRPKLPNEKLTTLEWHQDSFYYGGKSAGSDSTIILSVWIPLVDVDETNGCLQIIPGSNKWGLVPCELNEQGQLRPKEDVEARGKLTNLIMNVGDILLFDKLTLHKSLNNSSAEIRWSIDLRYSPTDQPMTWHHHPEIDKILPFMIGRSKSNPQRVTEWEDWYSRHLDSLKR